MLISQPQQTGVLIPIPQYPLYTASLSQHGGVPIPYYLDESKAWSTDPSSIRSALEHHKKSHPDVTPRAIVVINPGNPTGSVLDRETMKDILHVCAENSLVLMADEVYQSNIHHPPPAPQFTSFKSLVAEAQVKEPSSPIGKVSLFSFHSTSKGVTGECGRRGGYFECTNISPSVMALIYKISSVGLCPPVSGQIGVECMVNPPKSGEPSYELWKKETDTIHANLASRTKLIAERLNALEGVSCVDSPGALYLFPRLHLPQKALLAAQKAGKSVDAMYSLALLDETGICCVPGDGFGQVEGEAHLRLTCLVEGSEEYVGKLEAFHKGFMAKYKD